MQVYNINKQMIAKRDGGDRVGQNMEKGEVGFMEGVFMKQGVRDPLPTMACLKVHKN